MKLKNSLYTVTTVDKSEASITCAISLNSEHQIYKAHFPELPITPGVCIIQIGCELLNDALGKNMTLCEVANAKFLAVINPRDNYKIDYTFSKISTENGICKVTVTVHHNDVTFAKLSLRFKDE